MYAHPLNIETSWFPRLIVPVPVHAQVVDPVKCSVVIIEICFSQSPRVCNRQLLEVVPDRNELIIEAPEALGDGALPVIATGSAMRSYM